MKNLLNLIKKIKKLFEAKFIKDLAILSNQFEQNFSKSDKYENKEIINELNKEIEMIKDKNEEYLNKLNDELIIEKTRNKSIEEKLNYILDKKTSEYNDLNIEYNNKKTKFPLLCNKISMKKLYCRFLMNCIK